MTIDIIAIMETAGSYPLPPSTGVYFNYPGPRLHDGLVYGESCPEEGDKTYGKCSLAAKHIQSLLRSIDENVRRFNWIKREWFHDLCPRSSRKDMGKEYVLVWAMWYRGVLYNPALSTSASATFQVKRPIVIWGHICSKQNNHDISGALFT